MPSAAIAQERVNQQVHISNPDGRSTVADAVREAASCREALTRANLIEDIDPDLRDETYAVLEALPHAVDQALLAALGSVLDRGVGVSVKWEPGDRIALRIEEDADNGVLIVLETKDGREYR